MSILNGNRKKGEQSQVGSSIVQVGLAATMASMLSACGGGGGSSSGTTGTSASTGGASASTGGASASTGGASGGESRSGMTAIYDQISKFEDGTVTGKDFFDAFEKGLIGYQIEPFFAKLARDEFQKSSGIAEDAAVRLKVSDIKDTVYLAFDDGSATGSLVSFHVKSDDYGPQGLVITGYSLEPGDSIVNDNLETLADKRTSDITVIDYELDLANVSVEIIETDIVSNPLVIMKNTWDDSAFQKGNLPWGDEKEVGDSAVSLKDYDFIYAMVGGTSTKVDFNHLIMGDNFNYGSLNDVFTNHGDGTPFPNLPGGLGTETEDWFFKPNTDGDGEAYYDFQWLVEDSSDNTDKFYEISNGDDYFLRLDEAEFSGGEKIASGDKVVLEVYFKDITGDFSYYATSSLIEIVA